jgi:hypothetical protein
LVLGVGQGYAAHEFEAFGVDRRLRPIRLFASEIAPSARTALAGQ